MILILKNLPNCRLKFFLDFQHRTILSLRFSSEAQCARASTLMSPFPGLAGFISITCLIIADNKTICA